MASGGTPLTERTALLAIDGRREGDEKWARQQRAFRRRGLYLGLALFQSMWISGTVYGWPAFLLMLRAEHVYADRCVTNGAPPPQRGVEVFIFKYYFIEIRRVNV